MELDQFCDAIETIVEPELKELGFAKLPIIGSAAYGYELDLGTTDFVYLSIIGSRGQYNDINHYTMTLYTVDKQDKRKDLIKVEDYTQKYSMVAKKFQEIKDFLLEDPNDR